MKTSKLPLILLTLLILLLLASFSERIAFLTRSKSVVGKVVGVEFKADICRKSTVCTKFQSKIEYLAGDEKTYELYDTTWIDGTHALEAAPMKEGDSVELRYDPATPSYASLDSFGGIWASVIFVAVLLVALIIHYRVRTLRK